MHAQSIPKLEHKTIRSTLIRSYIVYEWDVGNQRELNAISGLITTKCASFCCCCCYIDETCFRVGAICTQKRL